MHVRHSLPLNTTSYLRKTSPHRNITYNFTKHGGNKAAAICCFFFFFFHSGLREVPGPAAWAWLGLPADSLNGFPCRRPWLPAFGFSPFGLEEAFLPSFFCVGLFCFFFPPRGHRGLHIRDSRILFSRPGPIRLLADRGEEGGSTGGE